MVQHVEISEVPRFGLLIAGDVGERMSSGLTKYMLNEITFWFPSMYPVKIDACSYTELQM